MKWRDLTAEELAAIPEARLGGTLLVAVLLAALLCLVAVAGWLFAFDRFREVGSRYMVAVSYAALLSFVFVVMTLLRLRHTPVAIAGGLLVWVLYRGGVAISYGAVAHWPLLVDMLGELVLAAGFCAYMAEAVRPNVYYRRRLPVR